MIALRNLEREADYIGLHLMANACLPLEAAPRVFQLLADFARRKHLPEPVLHRTHPRLAEVRSILVLDAINLFVGSCFVDVEILAFFSQRNFLFFVLCQRITQLNAWIPEVRDQYIDVCRNHRGHK